MPSPAPSAPLEDSVPKVDHRLAVGEDLAFQRKWWKFERGVWIVFFLILVADVLGAFGRGWLAESRQTDSAATLTLDYEHVERAGTPSIMTLHFGRNAIRDGHIQVFVSDSIVRSLGAERISPQPATSAIGDDGVTYSFDAGRLPATAQIELEPSFPGRHKFRVQVAGGAPIDSTIFVVP